MKTRLLFRGMLAKDLKTLMRDRHQVFALVVGFASAILTVGSIELSIAIEKSEKERMARAALETAKAESADLSAGSKPAGEQDKALPAAGDQANPLKNADPAVLRWLVIMCGVGVGWYASLFVLPLGFSTFAGERERGTLEVLLAAPVPDSVLYGFKSLSVTIPGIAYGLVLLALSLAYAIVFHPGMLGVLPLTEVLAGTALSVPLIAMMSGIHVALGACCSVRAKTTQSAGMLLGGIITAVFFLLSGAGALLFFTPAREPVMRAVAYASKLHFALQYLIVAAIFAAAWAFLYAIGRSLFVRERML